MNNYNYNTPITKEEIRVLNVSKTDSSNTVDFEYDGRFFEQRYNKGNGWGFKFITEYSNELHITNKNSVAAEKEVIYSHRKSTDFGKYLEYSLTKITF